MVSEMKSSRKRKCRSDEDIGKMSLGEFMQKGLEGDKALAPKHKEKNKEPRKVKPKPVSKKHLPKIDSDSETDSDGGKWQAESVDDIEDVHSDEELIAKPRATGAQHVEEAEEDAELEGIELSDEDDEDIADEDVKILTEKTLRHLLEQMRAKPDTSQIKRLTQMFTGAVREAAGDRTKGKYSVRGQRLFNAVVLACLQNLLPATHKVLKLPPPTIPKDGSKVIDPTKGHCWKKLKNPLTLYMADLLKLLGCITQQKLQLSLLRHLLLLLPFVRVRPQIEKQVLKCLSNLWSTGEESVRVVAFLCLIRLIRCGDDTTFQDILKRMYLAYVSNCKFTSPQTWPLISFMRRSLVEAYALRASVAYQHSFLYIRQLAITLRSAMTAKKKDSHKSVYNWQFVHSVLLWCHLLATLRTKAMEPLIYPVIQVAIGVLNLIPSEKYVPLRFHVIRGIIELSLETGTFVPVLPMLVSTLKLLRWNQKPKVISMKPMNLSCALRMSEKQVKESAFRDAVIELFQEMTLTYLAGVSHLLSFPEIVVASNIELKKLKFKIVKHQTVIKQLMEKMSENSRFIEKAREQSGLAIRELEKVASLELQLRGTTPLCVYLRKFEQLREKRLREANEDVVESYETDEDDKNRRKSKKSNDTDAKQNEEGMELDGNEVHSDDDSGPDELGELESDLDTEEEGDDQVGFEVANDDNLGNE